LAAGADSDGSEEYSVVAFLKEHGLQRVAVQLSEELGLEKASQLEHVTREQLDELDWLKTVQKETLLKLCRQVVADCLSPSADDQQSQASTSGPSPYSSDFSDSDREDEDAVLVAGRNVGNVEELEAKLKIIVLNFMWLMPNNVSSDDGHSPCGRWSFCMLLWILFFKNARYKQGYNSNMQRWLRVLDDPQTREDEMARQVQACVEKEVASHPLLDKIREKSQAFRGRPCVASIATIDHMVQHLLRKNAVELEIWRLEVIGKWYISDSETHLDFLQRANEFLRSSVDGLRRTKTSPRWRR
jgi:hypothetical protein